MAKRQHRSHGNSKRRSTREFIQRNRNWWRDKQERKTEITEQPEITEQMDLALPDLALPDLALPDLALPDLALPDLALVDNFRVLRSFRLFRMLASP